MNAIFMFSMLRELHIKNLGIIENECIRFGEGLNIISGETGSGKSLIMNALDLVLGSRAMPGMVRNGYHKAEIKATFEVKAKEENLENQRKYTELRREISVEGRSRIFYNGEASTLGQIRTIAPQLVEIHGQHENQRIMEIDTHMEYLDHFAETKEHAREVSELYRRYRKISDCLRDANIEVEEREHRKDFLHFSIDEIESFEPKKNEYEEMINERALIQNSGRFFQDICSSYSSLREEENAILDRLLATIQNLEPHADLLPEARECLEQLQEASYLLESATDFLREQKIKLQFSPEQLQDIEDRIAGYQALFKKYGTNTENVLQTKEKYLRELGSIEMSSEQIQNLKEELQELELSLWEKAEFLSRLRRSAIAKLEGKLAYELNDLGMLGAKIHVQIKREYKTNETNQTPSSENKTRYTMSEKGLDIVEFLLASNPGENPRPLRKIASGGELSRISLAFKNIFIGKQEVSSVVFDEVDAGVGGEVAHTIGKSLEHLSETGQVIVVTHLPQIARLGEFHFSVSKKYKDGRVFSQTTLLSYDMRLKELARMLGGIPSLNKTSVCVHPSANEVILEHAKNLLKPKVAV